jgi:hypothetical protein
MRKALIALALLATSLPSTAFAQIRVDMNAVTCRDWLGYSRENQEFISFWMSGYYNAAANSGVLDYSRLQRGSAKVLDYCKRHRSDTLPTAISKSVM